MCEPRVSFVISTYNRRDVLLQTLDRVKACEVPHEILLVDNASPDGSAKAVAEVHPGVRLFPLGENLGPCAKNIGLKQARGEYVVFLDDDSFPIPGALARMIDHFENDPRLGA